jgi:hypothetical protein
MPPTIQILLRAILLVAVVSGCAKPQMEEYREHIQGWVGLPTDRLMRIWGPPQRTAKLADDSTLLEYRERNVNRVAVPVTGGSATPRGVRIENRVSWCVTRFKVKNGIVESTSFEGADCQAP